MNTLSLLGLVVVSCCLLCMNGSKKKLSLGKNQTLLYVGGAAVLFLCMNNGFVEGFDCKGRKTGDDSTCNVHTEESVCEMDPKTCKWDPVSSKKGVTYCSDEQLNKYVQHNSHAAWALPSMKMCYDQKKEAELELGDCIHPRGSVAKSTLSECSELKVNKLPIPDDTKK